MKTKKQKALEVDKYINLRNNKSQKLLSEYESWQMRLILTRYSDH